jgi:hypothetical protein
MTQHPEINRMVGDSLGGNLVLEYERNNRSRNVVTRTYNTPVFSLRRGDRVGSIYDPLLWFDLGGRRFGTRPHTRQYERFYPE